jgi:hypothetical protein
MTLRVTDNGAPPLSDSEAIIVTVLAPVSFGSAHRLGDQLVLAWPSVPGGQYRIDYKNDLNAPQWTALTNITADAASTSITHSLQAPGQRFFRMVFLNP